MIVHGRRARSGITLTEILISIMIMGIGIVSLATLFPLGLLRLRDAARSSRSGFLCESAAGELAARNLLSKQSFLNPYVSPWYLTVNLESYDPWIQDTPGYGVDPYDNSGHDYGVYRGEGTFSFARDKNGNPKFVGAPLGFIPGPGLPVAYDPLWRYQTNYSTGGYHLPDRFTTATPTAQASEARFGSGIGIIRNDPGGGSSTVPSAHGLQRITNFLQPFLQATTANPYPVSPVPSIFISPEDMVLQTEKDPSGSQKSPIVPDLSATEVVADARTGMMLPVNDWRFTWMFTGQQADCTNGTVFDGNIVVFENRPFAINDPTGQGAPYTVEGERVVEAVFGYSTNVAVGKLPPPAVNTDGSVGYGASADRTVLLRWTTLDAAGVPVPDPEVKVGSWIADVTYERNATIDAERARSDPFTLGAPASYPYQRCDWYQVAKRTPATEGITFAGDGGKAYRQMTVWVTNRLKCRTLLKRSTGDPVHVNAALLSPYVVNVFNRTIYTR